MGSLLKGVWLKNTTSEKLIVNQEPAWTESIVVGRQRFIEGVREVVKSQKGKIHNDIKKNITTLI